jgi:hypothetical protein
MSRYTDYAIPAQIKYFTDDKINKYRMGRGVSDEYVYVEYLMQNLKERDDVQDERVNRRKILNIF